jgi:hypothetical protein
MALSPKEEQRTREEIRAKLEQKVEEKRKKEEQRERRRKERSSERDRQRILEEEEERFYEAQGLKKHISRHGGVEWMTPEEFRNRVRIGKERYRIRKKEKWKKQCVVVGRILILVLILGGLVGVLYKIRSMNVLEKKEQTTVVWVRSNRQGAAIYVDEQATGMVTDGIVRGLSKGKHIVAVALPGYLAIPHKREIQVVLGDTIEVSFELN